MTNGILTLLLNKWNFIIFYILSEIDDLPNLISDFIIESLGIYFAILWYVFDTIVPAVSMWMPLVNWAVISYFVELNGDENENEDKRDWNKLISIMSGVYSVISF